MDRNVFALLLLLTAPKIIRQLSRFNTFLQGGVDHIYLLLYLSDALNLRLSHALFQKQICLKLESLWQSRWGGNLCLENFLGFLVFIASFRGQECSKANPQVYFSLKKSILDTPHVCDWIFSKLLSFTFFFYSHPIGAKMGTTIETITVTRPMKVRRFFKLCQ